MNPKDYSFEQSLDEMLAYFASQGSHQTILASELPKRFIDEKLSDKIDTLLAYGLIVAASFDFGDNKPPVTFPGLYSVTPWGVNFSRSNSFVDIAKHQASLRRRFNLETWKIGFDTIIAILSLLISLAAILIALLK